MNMKNALISAMMVFTIGAATVASGTFALFTAEAKNTGNSIAAGTLSIATAAEPVFASTNVAYTNLAPGDSGLQTIEVQNTGSLDAWVRIKSITTEGSLFAGATPLSLTNNEVYQIPAEKKKTFTINYSFPKAADNSYQAASGTATINFEAVQVKNNSDIQWGNQVVETVGAGATKTVGTITVPVNAGILELNVSGLFSPETGAQYPDLTLISPNGEKFGYTGQYLNSSGYTESTNNHSSVKATYTGWGSNPEKMTFSSPIAGQWTVQVTNDGGYGSSTATVSANLPIVK